MLSKRYASCLDKPIKIIPNWTYFSSSPCHACNNWKSACWVKWVCENSKLIQASVDLAINLGVYDFLKNFWGCLYNKLISSFLLHLYLTGVHFRRELQYVGDVSEQKFKYGPIRTLEITDMRLLHELYKKVRCLLTDNYLYGMDIAFCGKMLFLSILNGLKSQSFERIVYLFT